MANEIGSKFKYGPVPVPVPVPVRDRVQWLAQVRADARRRAGSSPCPRQCSRQGCGYNVHVEVAHLLPVRDFKGPAMDAVNADANIAYLCPRCHWEFDHGLVRRQEVLSLAQVQMQMQMQMQRIRVPRIRGLENTGFKRSRLHGTGF